MDAGDVTAGLALAVSVAAAGFSWRSSRYERISAEAAKRSAEAAERANLLIEQQLSQHGQPAGGTIHWRIERQGKNGYLLRNTGSEIAEGVNIDPAKVPCPARNLPVDAVIRPGGSAEFLLIPVWGRSLPGEVWVSWSGSGGPRAVPLPPA